MRVPQPGFVFVLLNVTDPGLVKIGRAAGRSTVAHEEWVGDPAAVERRLRRHFAKRHVARRPGFFRVPVAEAVRALKATGGRVRKGRNYLRFQPAGLKRERTILQ